MIICFVEGANIWLISIPDTGDFRLEGDYKKQRDLEGAGEEVGYKLEREDVWISY
jgi:predicted secreted protein